MSETNYYYLCVPDREYPLSSEVEIVPTQSFLGNEEACRVLWELITTNFRTRWKFLTIWPSVRYVALHRDERGNVDGLLLISAPVNWQIDYVVVQSSARGQGIASALVIAALNFAYQQRVPYVMLTSREGLRPLYESCGFRPVAAEDGRTIPAASVSGGERQAS